MLVALKYYLDQAGIRLYDEDGQGLIEYVLIAALIAIAAIVGMGLVGGQLDTSFTNLQGDITIAP